MQSAKWESTGDGGLKALAHLHFALCTLHFAFDPEQLGLA
jgi:hypothetical protein